MRKVLGALVAFAAMPVATGYAADMALKAPPPVAAAVYSWTGFYLGGEVGGGWASETTTNIPGGGGFPAGFVGAPIHASGVLGGGYAGYNYQINNIVLGIDGYYDAADLTGSGNDVAPGPGLGTGNISAKNLKVSWDSAITGRLGIANNNWLFFVKGGWAWARFSGTSTLTSAAGAVLTNGTASSTRNGGTVGGGIEYGFASHWSAKLEYDYVKFRTANFNSTDVATGAGPAPAGTITTPARSASSNLNELKAGVAYRF
jgi:outer membrane immunogenic protein